MHLVLVLKLLNAPLQVAGLRHRLITLRLGKGFSPKPDSAGSTVYLLGRSCPELFF